MLDAFLEVIIKKEDSRLQEVKLANDLKRLPNETLYGIVTGKQKLAFGYSDEWLEKYKGTPLFEQAMALEKADLEAEISREQANAVQPDMSQFWKTQDQIRLQKKMLDLQLIELNEKDGLQMQPGGMLPESITPAAQGAGALGDVAAEGVQQGEAAKMAASNFAKVAAQMNFAGYANKAFDFVKRNPTAVGAGVGAVGGAIAGGPDHRLSGAMGGAALGAGAAHAGVGINKGMQQGKSFGQPSGVTKKVPRAKKPKVPDLNLPAKPVASSPVASPPVPDLAVPAASGAVAPAAPGVVAPVKKTTKTVAKPAAPVGSPHLQDLASQQAASGNLKAQMAGTHIPESGLFGLHGTDQVPMSYSKYSSAGIKMKIAFIRMNNEG